MTMAIRIAIATVYGRYHYAADAAAGSVIAALVYAGFRQPRAWQTGVTDASG